MRYDWDHTCSQFNTSISPEKFGDLSGQLDTLISPEVFGDLSGQFNTLIGPEKFGDLSAPYNTLINLSDSTGVLVPCLQEGVIQQISSQFAFPQEAIIEQFSIQLASEKEWSAFLEQEVISLEQEVRRQEQLIAGLRLLGSALVKWPLHEWRDSLSAN